MVRHTFCDLRAIFMLNIILEDSRQLRRIILSQLGLITFGFAYGGDRNLIMSWFRDF